MFKKIVSGGQTGVDRAALDVALSIGCACGGWCPRDRKAEDGTIASRYPMQETPSAIYAQRSEWNVRDSDGTLVLNQGKLTGGTAHSVEAARRLGKSCLVVDLDEKNDPAAVVRWAREHALSIVNVAGPRESKHPGIYAKAVRFLREVCAQEGNA